MKEEKSKSEPLWRVIKETVRGASHERSGLPNQDSVSCFPEIGEGSRIVLAVADGHGSAKYFRSDEGSRCAVSAATEVLEPLLKQTLNLEADPSVLSRIKRSATEQLPQQLVNAWRRAVMKHLNDHSFSSEEQNLLIEREGQSAWQAVEANPLIAYGSTMLAALVTESFIIYLQLGDGDILVVSEQAEVTRPIPLDQRLMANETTSLCSVNAWKDMYVHFQVLTNSNAGPALILISTDGYANSFRNEREFSKVGSDLLDMVRADGLEEVNGRLKSWLNDASHQGSGDDITLGIIARTQATQHTLVVSNTEGKRISIQEAVQKARPRARIFIEPGIYREACVIDKPLELIGQGPLDQIIIESSDQPCIAVQTDDVVIRNLTLRSRQLSTELREIGTVLISSGRSHLVDCDISSDLFASVLIHGATADPVIRGCKIHDNAGAGVMFSNYARGYIEQCEVYASTRAGIEVKGGSKSVISKCHVHDCKEQGMVFWNNGQGSVDDCEVHHNISTGVALLTGSDVVVRECRVYDNEYGIYAMQNKEGTIEQCQIFHNRKIGVAITEDGALLVRRCQIHDEQEYGMAIWKKCSADITGCEVYQSAFANMWIGPKSSPTIQSSKIYSGKKSGVVVDEDAQVLLKTCDIYENSYAGIEIKPQGNANVQNCRINRNTHTAILAYSKALGAVENCDLTANGRGAWEIENAFFKRIHRSGNTE